jgi:glycosyltransferase involved in cell wall biosynthesis
VSRVRVGIDAWGLGDADARSGMSQYAATLLRALPATKRIDVFAYGAPGEERPAWLDADVTWRAPRPTRARRLAALDSRLRWLPAAAAADGIDVFHSPGVHVRPSFPPVPRVQCPLVVTIHDVIPLSFYGSALPRRNRAFYRWNLRRAVSANRVLTVSEAAGDEIASYAAVDRSRITVVASSVDFAPNDDDRALSRLGVGVPFVLFAGSYEPRKNLVGALRAFERFAESGAPHALVAITDAESGHAPAVHDVLAGLACRDRVQLLHSVAEVDLRCLYTHACAVLFPSLAEGLGLPAIQAAACGVPVVVSDLPVFRETVGEIAVVADATDAASLSAALLRAVGAPARRLAALRGPAIAARFTPAQCAAEHADVYERLWELRYATV